MENTVNFSAPVYDFQNTRNFEELTHRDFHGVQNLKSAVVAGPDGKPVSRYVNPVISVKVARTHNTEEDIVILTVKYDDVLTGEIISQDYFARENATKEDLVALFPEYKETMSRDELNKLAPTKVKDFVFRVGIYRVLGEDGKPMRDDAGNSLVQMSTKWLSLTLANGVRLTALTAGSGTLYCFDSSGTLMGSVPVSSAFPEISVEDKTLDVLGDVVNLDLQGLSGVYSVRGSDALFNSLYGIVSIEPMAAVSSLYGQDFIYAGTEDKRLYVNKIRWSRAGVARDWTEAVGKSFPYRVTLACGISAEFNVIIDNPVLGPLEGDAYFGEAFDMTGVDDPLPAVASLGTQNSIVASVSSGIPQGFLKSRSEREADGWRTWFGGTRFVEGRIADDYITGYSTTLIRWDLPASAVRSIYGEAVPIFVGKLNPHCNEYVKACVGSYASTYYNPVGVDLHIETLYFSGTTTCLCFRPHSDDVTLDVTDGSFAYQGRDGGPLYSNESGIGPNGYVYHSNGTFLETNWDGDLMSNSDFSHGNGPFFGTSLFGYSVVSPYSTATYGAKGRRHLAIYRYSPYRYAGSHAWIADENGRVNCKGYVSVEKWSVSSKAYFDWDPSDFSRPSPSGDL